ncbi:MAG: carbohydrate transporter permease [Herbinix sp.]|jgi:raffinose/stachyose/melibiose transport system permease protein|nr:carbohydrate transporter permease [Herbinix sp.]
MERYGINMKKKKTTIIVGDIIGCAAALIIFVIPFLFMLMNSLKDRKEANQLNLSLPDNFLWSNYLEVIQTGNYQILTAFKNSGLITIGSVVVLIVTASMAGYIIQRRRDKVTGIVSVLIMVGLMIPPAILPTIWVLQKLHIYKSMFSIIMLEVALNTPFTVMLYRGFMSTIPIELEEAGYIDGCSKINMFTSIVFPLLKPVTATVIILNAVNIFNDFSNPLYFFPGKANSTVQLTLYNFMGQFSSSYNLLFADVIIIVVPMLILFLIFNKRIVDGMVAGAVKG